MIPNISRRTLLFSAIASIKHHQQLVLLCSIPFTRIEHGRSARRFYRPHGDEETARIALEKTLETAPGAALISTAKTRHVDFAGGRLDPNRMFSRVGAEANLRQLNPSWTAQQLTEALDQLDAGREQLVKALLPPQGGLLVAVHNNGPRYSVEIELPLSSASSLPRRAEPREFFLATSPADYARLAQGPYNAVLQDRPSGEDDGSLSRLCAARSVRYVNLEVAHSRLDIQVEMLAYLLKTLP